MCHTRIKHHDFGNECHCSCGPDRSFFTKEERMEKLKKYREQLEKEISGIDAHIQDLAQSN